MKDIQEIMLEMDNLSNQIATTLNEEDIIKEEEAIRETEETKGGGGCNQDIKVPFCCLTNCPQGFEPDTDKVRVTFNLNCLTTRVKPVCYSGAVSYEVRIVGCIPFVANVKISTAGNKICSETDDGNKPTPSLCCGCCVCVDELVCTTNSEWLALSKAANIDIKCNDVDVVNLNATLIQANQVTCGVKISGKFKIELLPTYVISKK